MKKEIISTEFAPKALGPYSQAVKYNGLIFLSGQIALDPNTNELVEEDFAMQAYRVLENIKIVISANGGTMDDCLKLSVYLHNISDFPILNKIFEEYFHKGDYPTRTVVGGVDLPKGSLLKIDVIAIDNSKNKIYYDKVEIALEHDMKMKDPVDFNMEKPL